MNETQNEGALLLRMIDDYIDRTGATRKFVANAIGLTPSLLSKREKLEQTVVLNTETALKAEVFFKKPGTFQRASVEPSASLSQLRDLQEKLKVRAEGDKIDVALRRLLELQGHVNKLDTAIKTLINELKNE